MASSKKSPAAKKIAPAKPVRFAKGKEVRVTRGGLAVGVGRYAGSEERGNGVWHQVNFAGKGMPADVRSYRASNLERIG